MKRPFKMSCYIPYALVLSIVFAVVSCSKDGDPGPAGPAGPAGPGGTPGAQGPKGDTGTANVIFSGWLDAVYGLDSTSGTWISIIDAPKLSQSILSSGEVKVYMNLRSAADPLVVPLPYIDENYLINVRLIEEAIGLLCNDDFSTYTNNNNEKVLQVRYVLIPGGTNARKAAGINWDDYSQVKKYLGLKD